MGDKVKVKPYKVNNQVCKAEIVEVLRSSTFRRTPLCDYFGNCGGCNFQHLKYEVQLETKVEIIRDCLKRIGKIDYLDEIPIIASPEAEYRIRAEWHVKGGKIGYFKRNSNELVEINACPILAPKLQDFLHELRLKKGLKSIKNAHIEVVTNNRDVSCFSTVLDNNVKKIRITTGSESYLLNARVFFQSNQFLLDSLIKVATEDFSGEVCLDLYCGVGFFTVPLARKFKRVFAVEQMPEAIKLAKENAERAKLKEVEFFTCDVKSFLSRNLPKFDLILLDPPRTGMEKEVIESVLRLEPETICYVSCDPATLSRDLRKLIKKYKIVSITALDLFPQTHHVETVVRLNKI